jgi:hypothetical protein
MSSGALRKYRIPFKQTVRCFARKTTIGWRINPGTAARCAA